MFEHTTTATISAIASAYNATLDGLEGIAFRDIESDCWFIAHNDPTSLLPLSNADIPTLHLHGLVALAEEQRIEDELAGGLLQLVDARNSEHARL